MPIDLEIEMRLSKKLAEAASKDFWLGESQRQQKASDAAEKAQKKATADLKREMAEQAKEVQKFLKEQEKAAREAAAARSRSAKAAAAAETAELREADKVARGIVAEARRAQIQAERDKRREKAESNREEARLLRELAQRQRENAREAKAQRRQDAQEQKAIQKDQTDAWAEQGSMISTAGGALAAFSGTMFGLASAGAIVNEIQAAFQRARDTMFESTNMLHDYRENLLELAALKDRLGGEGQELGDTLRLQAATGQKRDDVINMQKSFLGVAESAIGKTIAKDQVGEALKGIGSLQALEQGDAGAYGQLGGLLAQTMKGKDGGMVTGKALSDEAAAMYQISKPGGFSFSTAMADFGKVMPSIKSGEVSGREAMGILSAFSIANPGGAAESFEQLARGTTGSLMRDTKGKVRPLEGLEAQGRASYLEDIGAKVGMNPIDITRRMLGDVQKQEALAKKEGREFSRSAYWQTKGYNNMKDLDAIKGMSSMIEDQTWDTTFKPMIEDQKLGVGKSEEITKEKAQNMTVQRRMSKAAAEASKANANAGQGEWNVMMREFGYSTIDKSQRADMPEFQDIEKSSYMQPMNWLPTQLYKPRVDEATTAMVSEQAQKFNVPYQSTETRVGKRTMDDNELFRVSRELSTKHGVDFGQIALQKQAEASDKMLQAAGMLNRAIGAPAAMDGAPKQGVAAP